MKETPHAASMFANAIHSFVNRENLFHFSCALFFTSVRSLRLAVCECVIYLVHTQRAAIILSIFIYFCCCVFFFRTATNRRNVDNKKFRVEKKKLHVNVCTRCEPAAFHSSPWSFLFSKHTKKWIFNQTNRIQFAYFFFSSIQFIQKWNKHLFIIA